MVSMCVCVCVCACVCMCVCAFSTEGILFKKFFQNFKLFVEAEI